MIETGVSFDQIHSFYDLGLILSKVEITPAKPKTNYVDIPGADGSIDLTEANGEVKFYDRTIKFTFTMNPSGDLSEAAYEAKKTEVSNALSGKACKLTLDKDAEYYYTGRCTVDEFLSNKRVRQIVVVAQVAPYKLKQHETVITTAVGTGALVPISVILKSRKTVCPQIECDGNVLIVKGDSTYAIPAGTTKLLNIEFKQGNNQISFRSTDSDITHVTLRFREGDL